MGKGLEKRKRIFAKYTGQLKSLHESKLISDSFNFNIGSYVCPICLNEFSEDDLSNSSVNMLTLEDAPPKSLGGHANTLTCKTCNSKSGHEIDFHLTEHLIEKDVRDFLPDVKTKAKFLHKGTKVQGEMKVDSKGKITVIHHQKINNPELLKTYIEKTGKDDLISIEFNPSRVDKLRLEVALLKSAYILAFEHFGYALIMNNAFDIVRDQLRSPEKQIYPEGFWTKQSSFRANQEGVHLIVAEGFEGFYSIFSLRTKSAENWYGVYLPISVHTTKDVIDKLNEHEGGFGLSLESLKANNYLEDVGQMRLLTAYINNRNTP